jgi:hypothetical protein
LPYPGIGDRYSLESVEASASKHGTGKHLDCLLKLVACLSLCHGEAVCGLSSIVCEAWECRRCFLFIDTEALRINPRNPPPPPRFSPSGTCNLFPSDSFSKSVAISESLVNGRDLKRFLNREGGFALDSKISSDPVVLYIVLKSLVEFRDGVGVGAGAHSAIGKTRAIVGSFRGVNYRSGKMRMLLIISQRLSIIQS